MSKAYSKFTCRIKMSADADYTDPEISEVSKEHTSALNDRTRDDVEVPASPSTVTIAIGTETVAGMLIQNRHATKSLTVKWPTSNEVTLGPASAADPNNGEWMFVPNVASSGNVTLEGVGGASRAMVKIIHTDQPPA